MSVSTTPMAIIPSWVIASGAAIRSVSAISCRSQLLPSAGAAFVIGLLVSRVMT